MNRFAAILVLALPFAAHAAGKGGPPPVQLSDKQLHQIVRDAHVARIDGLRQRSRFFSKITQQRDYRGERVVHRDGNVTAFLDLTDPQHPGYSPERADEDESMASLPPSRRTHILVVPNQPREHIGKSVTGTITLADIEATKTTLEAAHRIANDLGVKNPRIYMNTQDRLAVGYQHVHIVGERTKAQYPNLSP